MNINHDDADAVTNLAERIFDEIHWAFTAATVRDANNEIRKNIKVAIREHIWTTDGLYT